MNNHRDAPVVRPFPAALLTVVQPLLDRLVDPGDPETCTALARLENRCIAVVLDFGSADRAADTAGDPAGSQGAGVLISVASGRMWVTGYEGDTAGESMPDVEITATAPSLLRAMLSGEREGLRIRGQAERLADLQQALKAGFARIAPERLAAGLERLAANAGRAGGLGPLEASTRDAGHWVRKSATRLAEDAVVFLQRERGWLPEPGAVEVWRDDVADLRDRLARLDARIALLEHAAGAASQPAPDPTLPRSRHDGA